MTALVLMLLVVAVLVGLWVACVRNAPPARGEEPNAERATQVGVELHGLRRRLDSAWLRTRVRADADATRREIEKQLKDWGRDV